MSTVGSELQYVQVAAWGSLTRRSGCSHHGSKSVVPRDITTSLAKFDLGIAGKIPSRWMQAPSLEMKVRVSGICKSMCCRVAAPTSIVTVFCHRWSQAIHHFGLGYLLSFPAPIPKCLPEWKANWWKVFKNFIQFMCCDRKLNFHHELAPCEVILEISGARQDETLHDIIIGRGRGGV